MSGGRFHRHFFEELSGFQRGLDAALERNATGVQVGREHTVDVERARIQTAAEKRARKAAKRAQAVRK